MNHKTKPYLLILLLLISVSATACAYKYKIPIVSTPEGAKVLMDGKDTGELTPAKILLRRIPVGDHDITVQKEGYAVPQAQNFKVIVAKGKIILTVFIPELFVPLELLGRRWKHALPNSCNGSVLRDGFVFELQPEIATVSIPSATIIEK